MKAKNSITHSGQAATDTYSLQPGRYRDSRALMNIARSIADSTTDAQHQDEEEKMKMVLAEIANEESFRSVFDSVQV